MKNKTGRELFSVTELYWILYHGIRTMKYMSRAKKNKELSTEFIERIMLAVTEVNRCEMCSYAHTKMALEAGMSNEEIQKMLSGVITDIPADQLPAVMFAQHYADSRGKPSNESWNRVLEVYGLSKAQGILGTIRVIMIGNALGIPMGSFVNRFRGKPDKRSNIFYELSIIIMGVLFIPILIVHLVIFCIFRVPIINI